MPAKVNTAPVHRSEVRCGTVVVDTAAVAADLAAVAVEIAAMAVDIAAMAVDIAAVAVDLAAVALDASAAVDLAAVDASAAVDVAAAVEHYNQQSMASPLHRMLCRNSSCNSHCPWPTLCV